MIFSVGQHAYPVRVTTEPIHNAAGEELWALCDPEHREILLSPRMAADERLRCVRHEYWHCWCNHHPLPADEEAMAILFATVSEEFDAQFHSQGGLKALLALEPRERPAPGDREIGRPAAAAQPIVIDRITCAVCDAEIMCGSFVTGPATFFAERRLWACRRAAWCEACNSVTVWWESCSEKGHPLGAIAQVATPRVLRGAEARKFLTEHPQMSPSLVPA